MEEAGIPNRESGRSKDFGEIGEKVSWESEIGRSMNNQLLGREIGEAVSHSSFAYVKVKLNSLLSRASHERKRSLLNL